MYSSITTSNINFTDAVVIVHSMHFCSLFSFIFCRFSFVYTHRHAAGFILRLPIESWHRWSSSGLPSGKFWYTEERLCNITYGRTETLVLFWLEFLSCVFFFSSAFHAQKMQPSMRMTDGHNMKNDAPRKKKEIEQGGIYGRLKYVCVFSFPFSSSIWKHMLLAKA